MRIVPSISLLFSIGLFAFVADAQAISGEGYPCKVVYRHPINMLGSLTLGSAGAVRFDAYTAPNCGGAFVGSLNLYSAGSNVASYGGSATSLYSEPALMANFTALQHASASGQRISFTGLTIKFGSQATSVTFGDY